MSIDSIASILKIMKNEKGEYPFKIVDSKSDLGIFMIHYDVDTIGQTPKDSVIREFRGAIVSEEKGVIVPSFGYTPTIITDSFPELDEVMKDKDGNEHTLTLFGMKDVFPMFDGTLLRVWKYNGNIFISTHKKMDASNSRWGTSGKFVELFTKYTENTFKVEDLFPMDSAENMNDVKVHNFLLVDSDLMIASKIGFGTSENVLNSGFVVYVNSFNCELPVELPKVHYTEVASCEHTVMKVQSLKNKEEYNLYLQKGFFPTQEDIHSNISLGEGLILYNGKSMLKMVSSGYNRRSKIVDNDPNILHRVYEILTESAFPKDGVDTYLEKFPAIPCPSDSQIEEFGNGIPKTLVSSFPEDWNTYSDQELTENNDRETRERRFRNAVVHYAVSLPLCHQKGALTAIVELLRDRFKAVQIVCGDYEKFAKCNWENVTPRDLKVYERIRTIVTDSKKFAKVRLDKGENVEGKTVSQILRKFTIEGIRNLMFKEYGVSIYKIVRVLVNDPKKKEE
jgi:hypothetical protein